VYGDPHLGHARSAVVFDVLFRYLRHLDYKVRFVRNITDVGHLVGDADEGEDKIGKLARLQNLEPMEVAQHYSNRYHYFMDKLGVLRPSIEPRATGHIPEQIEMIQRILDNGFAYLRNGSVYFDVPAYIQAQYPYGKLSGRNLDDMLSGSRDLDGQDEKRNAADFALWKKAAPEHLMRWHSPWSDGFPGWHIECSAMSTKYLGNPFDIHAGGMDLLFPHHEAEIAQTNACDHEHAHSGLAKNQARYWLHNNMITIGGQKMGKSLGNFITLEQFFSGDHAMLTQAYSPMTIRFFILQAHYRSTLDFSNEALQAAEKGYKRLMQMLAVLSRLKPAPASTIDVAAIRASLSAAMNDDVNTAIALAALFDAARIVNAVDQKQEKINEADLHTLQSLLPAYVYNVLGLSPEDEGANNQALDGAMQVLIEMRQEARKAKNFALSDGIRDKLKARGIALNDGPDGTTWLLEG
jgi:cysteinyl-tRNA synthetase